MQGCASLSNSGKQAGSPPAWLSAVKDWPGVATLEETVYYLIKWLIILPVSFVSVKVSPHS